MLCIHNTQLCIHNTQHDARFPAPLLPPRKSMNMNAYTVIFVNSHANIQNTDFCVLGGGVVFRDNGEGRSRTDWERRVRKGLAGQKFTGSPTRYRVRNLLQDHQLESSMVPVRKLSRFSFSFLFALLTNLDHLESNSAWMLLSFLILCATCCASFRKWMHRLEHFKVPRHQRLHVHWPHVHNEGSLLHCSVMRRGKVLCYLSFFDSYSVPLFFDIMYFSCFSKYSRDFKLWYLIFSILFLQAKKDYSAAQRAVLEITTYKIVELEGCQQAITGVICAYHFPKCKHDFWEQEQICLRTCQNMRDKWYAHATAHLIWPNLLSPNLISYHLM
jgi:hypothetical protein